MQDSDPKLASGASLLTLALAVGAAAAYLLVWSLLGGTDGCGPPGHSAAGRILVVAPFALPLAGGVILLAIGLMRRWRGPTLVRAALTILLVGGLLEFCIFVLELAVHRCTE